MPKSVEITVGRQQSDKLVELLHAADGVLGVRLYRDVSISPPGDVIQLETTDRGLHQVMRVLTAEGVGVADSTSITTSEPTSVISRSSREIVARDTSEGTFEETELLMARESNMTLLHLLAMAAAGTVAAVGLATNAVHLVIGAMVIAPGFQPIVRVSLGLVTRSAAWKRGLVDVALGYGALSAAAAATTLILRALGIDPLGTQASYLPPGVLLSYWTSISGTDVLVALVAGVAGTLLIVIGRSVLTAGVMVALALVPGSAIAGMALVSLEIDIALRASARWVVDAVAVVAVGMAVLWWRQVAVYRRPARL
ncbi:MAG: DUF389 domain-containing protein [Chloroflexota bacterium]|nr:DUF389 domain-containing protein [Chloroflexota bacterium]